MKVIGITSTYPESQLGAADAVVKKLAQIRVGEDGGRKLKVDVAGTKFKWMPFRMRRGRG